MTVDFEAFMTFPKVPNQSFYKNKSHLYFLEKNLKFE